MVLLSMNCNALRKAASSEWIHAMTTEAANVVSVGTKSRGQRQSPVERVALLQCNAPCLGTLVAKAIVVQVNDLQWAAAHDQTGQRLSTRTGNAIAAAIGTHESSPA